MKGSMFRKIRYCARTTAFFGLILFCLLVSACIHTAEHGWREYKIFCGMSCPDGEVTEAQWNRFCEEYVTPVFPDGYTTMQAAGHWKSKERSAPVREKSRVIVVSAPADALGKIRDLAKRYRQLFKQECVLVVTTDAAAEFVSE